MFQVVAVLVVLLLVAVPVWWALKRTSTFRRKRNWKRTVGTVVGFDTPQ